MGVREYIARNSKWVGVAAGVIALGAGIYAFTHQDEGGGTTSKVNCYYTEEDGESLRGGMTSDLYANLRLSPPKYKAGVFTCDHGGHRFAAYITRYSLAAVDAVAAAEAVAKPLAAKLGPNDPAMVRADDDVRAKRAAVIASGEVKKPGKGNWVSMNSPEAPNIMEHVKCPDGSDAQNVVP